MAIAQVHNWLSGSREYNEGVKLFEQIGGSKVVLRILRKKETEYTREKLIRELTKFVQNQSEARPDPVPETALKEKKTHFKKVSKPRKYQKINIEALPDDLKELNVKKGELFREMSHLQAQLVHSLEWTEKEREKKGGFLEAICNRILDREEEIDQIWEKLDYFQKHGRRIGKNGRPHLKEMNAAELLQRKYTLRTYLSRYKDNPEKHNKYEKELEEVENLLNDA